MKKRKNIVWGGEGVEGERGAKETEDEAEEEVVEPKKKITPGNREK